jgi:hypothetical protein
VDKLKIAFKEYRFDAVMRFFRSAERSSSMNSDISRWIWKG